MNNKTRRSSISKDKEHSRPLYKTPRKTLSKKAITLIGSVVVALIAMVVIIAVLGSSNLFEEKLSVEVDSKSIIGEEVLDENAAISPEVSDKIYNDLNAYSSEDDETRKTHTIDYFRALIRKALDDGRSDYAAVLLFNEYDYFVAQKDEASALRALQSVKLDKFAEKDRKNIERMISECEDRAKNKQ